MRCKLSGALVIPELCFSEGAVSYLGWLLACLAASVLCSTDVANSRRNCRLMLSAGSKESALTALQAGAVALPTGSTGAGPEHSRVSHGLEIAGQVRNGASGYRAACPKLHTCS